MHDNEKILFKILAENTQQKNIFLNSLLTEDLGFTSLGLINLSMELSRETNYDIIRASKEVDFAKIKTVRDLLNLINKFQFSPTKTQV